MYSDELGKVQQEFRMRDWLVSRQRYWGVPVPIINCQHCGPVPVPKEDLPVVLPVLEDTNLLSTNALSKIESFVDTKCPKCDSPAKRDTDTLDTFVDSSWYFLRFLDPKNVATHVTEEVAKKWMPVDIYIGGTEHAIMHLLYARFIHKVLCDDSLESVNREPFKELITQGLVKAKVYKEALSQRYLTKEEAMKRDQKEIETKFEKMSKSKNNGVSPGDIIDKWGADVLRLALLFAAPPESDINYDESILDSMNTWVEKLINLADTVNEKELKGEPNKVLLEKGYRLLNDVHYKIT